MSQSQSAFRSLFRTGLPASILALGSLIAFGCTNGEDGATQASPEFDFSADTRIVTIGGAATEIVFALGGGDQVVAVDLSSTFPAHVRNLPQVGYVRSISPEGILSAEPDLIVTTGAFGPPPAREIMEKQSVPIIWLPDPKKVEDVYTSIDTVANYLNTPDEASSIKEAIQSQIEQAQNLGSTAETKLGAIFFLRPPSLDSGGMAGGANSQAATLIELAGGRNVADGFSGFQPVSIESVVAMNPDVIFIGQSSEHGASPEAISALQNNPSLSQVPAIKNGAIYPVPMDDLTFGPRIGEAALRWQALLSNDAESASLAKFEASSSDSPGE